jgi:hypothetical protein
MEGKKRTSIIDRPSLSRMNAYCQDFNQTLTKMKNAFERVFFVFFPQV